MANDTTIRETVILGSGPAGLTAALYAARANLKPLVITGNELGGQIATTTEVENFPGFPQGLTGPELVEKMQEQAERFGADVTIDTIQQVDLSRRPFRLTGHSGDYYAKSLIITTGASPRKLGVPGEPEFVGRGVSYCATCDGFFFRDKDVVVIGGGDSALQEAIFLTKFARQVTIIHRRDSLRAGYTLQERARKNEKIAFIWDTVVTKINGDPVVTSIELKNVKTGETWTRPTDGVFIFIGHLPNSYLFQGQLAIDDQGYLITDKELRTSVEGVWAAGEITDPIFKQAITSAGMGAAAAIAAERWLAEHEDETEPALVVG
ncbi:MAG: thioredoxin-disulfide reductase [Anaerolineae bacterium]|nr:thioredoxin-disulfide reductase [Anaerolineales bacterium]MCQ3973326.1 thioredoxin-disulfide reductase [Anaerolineae bacterium]